MATSFHPEGVAPARTPERVKQTGEQNLPSSLIKDDLSVDGHRLPLLQALVSDARNRTFQTPPPGRVSMRRTGVGYHLHGRFPLVARMIVDREGMATEFLTSLHAEGRSVVTILQTNQYRDLSSFSDVGAFVPLSRDIHGKIIREVAPARISLPREDHPDDPLCLQVALIRDLRRAVPVQPDPEEAEIPSRWDSDLPADERAWWRDGWQAIALLSLCLFHVFFHLFMPGSFFCIVAENWREANVVTDRKLHQTIISFCSGCDRYFLP